MLAAVLANDVNVAQNVGFFFSALQPSYTLFSVFFGDEKELGFDHLKDGRELGVVGISEARVAREVGARQLHRNAIFQLGKRALGEEHGEDKEQSRLHFDVVCVVGAVAVSVVAVSVL